jgi:putative zinc finger/helix-turn-helix YgiT family protein
MNPVKGHSDGEELVCPNCDSVKIVTERIDQQFKYGVGNNAVDLQVVIPVRTCLACGLQFTDIEAEDARDIAIRKHLSVYLPDEITAIRENHGLSRQQFSLLTGIGPASLARWESGTLIQNQANDRYLYLLNFEENVTRLRLRTGLQQEGSSPNAGLEQAHVVADRQVETSQCRQFRALKNVRTHRERAASWHLRSGASRS